MNGSIPVDQHSVFNDEATIFVYHFSVFLSFGSGMNWHSGNALASLGGYCLCLFIQLNTCSKIANWTEKVSCQLVKYLCLTTDSGVQIVGSEHYAKHPRGPWSCCELLLCSASSAGGEYEAAAASSSPTSRSMLRLGPPRISE